MPKSLAPSNKEKEKLGRALESFVRHYYEARGCETWAFREGETRSKLKMPSNERVADWIGRSKSDPKRWVVAEAKGAGSVESIEGQLANTAVYLQKQLPSAVISLMAFIQIGAVPESMLERSENSIVSYMKAVDGLELGDYEDLSSGTSGRGRFMAKIQNSKYYLHKGNLKDGHVLLNPALGAPSLNSAQVRPLAIQVVLVTLATEKTPTARL